MAVFRSILPFGRSLRLAAAAALALLACSAVSGADPWPRIEAALSRWNGPKRVVLRTDLPDPLASPVVQELLELLLEHGYEAAPAPVGAPGGEGLTLDVRRSGAQTLVALGRGADGVVLALERRPAGVTGQRSGQLPSAPAPAAPAPAPRPSRSEKEAPEPPGWGPVPVAGHPVRIAALGGSPDAVRLAVLFPDGVAVGEASQKGVEILGRFAVPFSPSRGLHVDAADLDGDGTKEIAAVWAEDRTGIYKGVDSQLHGWVLHLDGDRIRPAGDDLRAYLRTVGDRVFSQRRGEFAPYEGPIVSLRPAPGGFALDGGAVDWARRALFFATPWDAAVALVWDEGSRLSLADLRSGEDLPGMTLLASLGPYRGPEVAVRLANPEFRSGFEKEDRVTEVYHALPPRVVLSGDSAYTIERARTPGLPLVGKPSGRDSLVQIRRSGRGLRLERPFPPVDAFVQDFALLDAEQEPAGVLLLVNEKADGSGRAYLLWQSRKRGAR
ncbi:MAG: hypothetical protein Kow0092_06780 [Deferrisomatales bacterium]